MSDIQPDPIILIHGGAGVIDRRSMTPEKVTVVKGVLTRSAQAGYNVLANGGTSLKAVVCATKVLEDSDHFNAGKGSVFNRKGFHEMDAGLMCGRTGEMGCVAALKMTKNPILAAEVVLQKCPHPYLTGSAAEEFVTQHGIELATSIAYFYSQYRFDQLQLFLKSLEFNPNAAGKVDHDISATSGKVETNEKTELKKQTGTVGAVALDSFGNLATSSSTGGMTGKMAGRVSDSSIAGAGFWADEHVAVSMTGYGDRFIETCAAHELAAELKFTTDRSLHTAAESLVHTTLSAHSSGLIALDRAGNWTMPYNSLGMYRALMKGGMDSPMVGIWDDFQ